MIYTDLKTLKTANSVPKVLLSGVSAMITSISQAKGCITFAVNESTGMLATASRRKIMLYQWDGSEFDVVRELILPVWPVNWSGVPHTHFIRTCSTLRKSWCGA